jgi:hypothetical protein
VIENSRVLLHAEHAQESRDSIFASENHADTPYWVYVTHSPKGTYVILGPTDGEGSASGIFLPEVNGAKLSEVHFSFDDNSAGLMFAQSAGMSQYLTTATGKAFEVLAPLSDAIRALVPNDRGICLIIGGLYVTLPVCAALTVDSTAPYPYVTVVLSRSQTLTKEHSATWNQIGSPSALSVPTVPWVPDLPSLTYPNDEVDAVEHALSTAGVQVFVTRDASVIDFEAAFEGSSILHFSGHSIGRPIRT